MHPALDDFFPEPSFMEKYPWAVPIIVLACFFTFAGIFYYCMYRNCREYLTPWWRRPAVVVVHSAPNGNSVHYPPNTGNVNYPGNTNFTGTTMTAQYPYNPQYSNAPPPYVVTMEQPQNTNNMGQK